jgi:hypothetical protein
MASPSLRRQALQELEAEPPKLIIGTFLDYLDDDGRNFIERGWHKTKYPLIQERNDSSE